MAVSSANLVIYTAANMPEDDSSTAGGAINSGIRATFTDPASATTIQFVSTSASDTQNVVLTGRNAAGAIISETIALDGTNPKTGTNTYERVLKCILASAAVGTVTVSGTSESATVTDIPPLESGFRRPFYDATASAVSTVNLYEKVFVMNNNTSSTLNNATLTEVSNGLYNKINFSLENAKQATTSVANRTIAPGSTGPFGTGPSGMVSNELTARDYQGVWMNLTMAAAEPAQNSYYEVQISGTTA